MTTAPGLLGLHHVTIPVTDLDRSRDWYVTTLDLATTIEEESEDAIIAVTLENPAGTIVLRLRPDAERARTLAGFRLLSLRVASRADLDRWLERLAELDVPSSAVRPAHLGWAVVLTDPDGIELQLHTREIVSAEFG